MSSGLGAAIALSALENGDVVGASVRRPEDRAAFEAIAPGRAKAFLLDVRDHAALEGAILAMGLEDGLDVLVNNAGYGLIGALEEASAAEVRDQFEVNVFAPIAAAKAALPGMRSRGCGRIINIGSISGLAPWAGTAIYTASKYALEGAMLTLADEVRPFGVFVTTVEPGGLRTEFAGRSMRAPALRLSAYVEGAASAGRILAEGSGREPGDPRKAAAAIIALAANPAPPRQLVLGADAAHYVEMERARFDAEMRANMATTLSISA